MTEILKIKGDWEEVANDCRATVHKPELGHEPSTEFKRKMVIAEHDPIRDIEIKFRWRGIPYWVAMHWKTHIWRSRTNTQRNDRQNDYDRNDAPQAAPVDFTGDMNAQHGIDTMRKRLCNMAANETRILAFDLKATVHKSLPEIADSWVPNCVYRCGCPEPNGCGLFASLVELDPDFASTDIQKRYDAYNCFFNTMVDF